MNVLVVEDYADTRELVRMMLELHGCRVIEAADGREAVEIAKSNVLDLVLMDLNLPVLDGYEATKQILSCPDSNHPPIVAFSAQCRGEGGRQALAAGCLECVQKPIDIDQINELLDRYAARKQP